MKDTGRKDMRCITLHSVQQLVAEGAAQGGQAVSSAHTGLFIHLCSSLLIQPIKVQGLSSERCSVHSVVELQFSVHFDVPCCFEEDGMHVLITQPQNNTERLDVWML